MINNFNPAWFKLYDFERIVSARLSKYVLYDSFREKKWKKNLSS